MSHEEEIQDKLQLKLRCRVQVTVRLVSLLFLVKTRTPTATGPLVSLACFNLSEKRVGVSYM